MNGKKRVQIGAEGAKRTTAEIFLDFDKNHFSETETVCLQEKSNMEIKDPIFCFYFFFFA